MEKRVAHIKSWQECRSWQEWDSPPLPVRMQNGTAALEKSLVISYKIKFMPTIRLSPSTP